ncbi:hypothetical protein BAE44_0016142, partial [Dichanthelium oligosanthes]
LLRALEAYAEGSSADPITKVPLPRQAARVFISRN